jgi:hypothetical protein
MKPKSTIAFLVASIVIASAITINGLSGIEITRQPLAENDVLSSTTDNTQSNAETKASADKSNHQTPDSDNQTANVEPSSQLAEPDNESIQIEEELIEFETTRWDDDELGEEFEL